MARIWANQLEMGTFTFDQCPLRYQAEVKEVLKQDVENGIITAERYEEITGEKLVKSK